MSSKLTKPQEDLLLKMSGGAVLISPKAGGRPMLKPAGVHMTSYARADTVQALEAAGRIRLGALRDRFDNPVYELVPQVAAAAPEPAGWPFPVSAHAGSRA